MNEFLQHIYDRIADERWNFTEREFSRDYLGKCDTYFAYLKSTGRQPSSDAMLKLWRSLIREKRVTGLCLEKATTDHQKRMLSNWATLYEQLGQEVFTNAVMKAEQASPNSRQETDRLSI